MNPNIFKAYDIRGKYPEEIDEKAVAQICGLVKNHFKQGKIIVAHDSRLSSDAIYKTILNEFGSDNRFQVESIGLSTTPMFYFLVNELKADFGIMVSGSHNPKEYNGLKIVSRGAELISGKEIYQWIT